GTHGVRSPTCIPGTPRGRVDRRGRRPVADARCVPGGSRVPRPFRWGTYAPPARAVPCTGTGCRVRQRPSSSTGTPVRGCSPNAAVRRDSQPELLHRRLAQAHVLGALPAGKTHQPGRALPPGWVHTHRHVLTGGSLPRGEDRQDLPLRGRVRLNEPGTVDHD